MVKLGQQIRGGRHDHRAGARGSIRRRQGSAAVAQPKGESGVDCVRRWVGRRFWGELWAMWAGMGMGMGGDGGQRRLGLVPVRACILGPGARARWGGGEGGRRAASRNLPWAALP